MRQKIRRERQVELALETHRYFDCNRWKISDQVKAVHGMDIGARDNSFFKRTLVEERVFEAPKHYLWPFIKMKLIRILIFLYRIRDGVELIDS
jgi:hypothetical protein